MGTKNVEEIIYQGASRALLVVDENGQAQTPAPAFVNATAAGATQVVAAVAGKRIRALTVVMVAKAAVDAKFQSAATDISATFGFAAGGTLVLPEFSSGWFQTAVNEPLNINLATAVAVGVHVSYYLVD